jgi:hypothetical protein
LSEDEENTNYWDKEFATSTRVKILLKKRYSILLKVGVEEKE